MPYNKNKQQAFQAAQQGATEAVDAYNSIVKDSAEYGHQLQHLSQEINEAYQQIDSALGVASEHQEDQLRQMKSDLEGIMNQLNQ